MNEVDPALLAEVKNYLDITWSDPDSEKKLSGLILRGIDFINSVGATEFDYTKQGKPLELLLDYVRYARSNALDEFHVNYLKDLRWLQIQVELGKYDKK